MFSKNHPRNILRGRLPLLFPSNKNWTLFTLLFFFLSLPSCDEETFPEPTVKIETNFGDIYVQLFPGKAPKTVSAFLGYADAGLYKESSFYRVLKEEDQPSSSFKSELIQGGLWQARSSELAKLRGIEHEPTTLTGLLHENGTISLARTDTGTATSEFFICIGKQPAYDFGGAANPDGQGFAAFGKVVKGMDVVKAIHSEPNDETNFQDPVEIIDITRAKSKK